MDPFTQIRFTSSNDVLVQACADCVHLPIHATISAGKCARLAGALGRGKQRAAWVSQLSIETHIPSTHTADPTIAKVSIGNADAFGASEDRRSLYLKNAPGKNSSTMVAQCAWLTIEPHPHVLPVILTAGPNLFLFSRRFMASSNALHWLRCDSQVAVLSGAARRRLVCSILLQVANAVQHIHSEGAMHLDLKPDNVLVAVCDSIDGTNHSIDMYAADGTAALETRVLGQLCDWELSSMFEGVPGARSGGGTPGFWAPEQVTPLPVLKATTPLSTQAVEHSAMSSYWRQVCLDPPPTPVQPEKVSTLSDSWGLATLLLALTEDLPTMRLDGFTRFRHSLCKSARRLGGTHVGDPAAIFVGGLAPTDRHMDALDLAPNDTLQARCDTWEGPEGACLAYVAAACLQPHAPSRLPVAGVAQRLRCTLAPATAPSQSLGRRGAREHSQGVAPADGLSSSVSACNEVPAVAAQIAHGTQTPPLSPPLVYEAAAEEGGSMWDASSFVGGGGRGGIDRISNGMELMEAERVCHELMGPRNEEVWRAKLRCATVLVSTQRLVEAEEVCVVILTEMVEGPAELSLVALAQTQLASALAQQHRYEESLDCYARAAHLYADVSDMNAAHLHLDPASVCRLARLRASMGLVQERMGQMQDALALYEQALVLYETYLGKWHARVGGVLVAMAGACQRLKQWRQALALYLRAHAVFSRALGRDHLVLAEVQNHIGVCLVMCGVAAIVRVSASMCASNRVCAHTYSRREM